jgi:hypothetical protein
VRVCSTMYVRLGMCLCPSVCVCVCVCVCVREREKLTAGAVGCVGRPPIVGVPYVVMVSTFEPNQLGPYALTIQSARHPFSLTRL